MNLSQLTELFRPLITFKSDGGFIVSKDNKTIDFDKNSYFAQNLNQAIKQLNACVYHDMSYLEYMKKYRFGPGIKYFKIIQNNRENLRKLKQLFPPNIIQDILDLGYYK